MTAACQKCGEPFARRRRSALFCSVRCRVAAHRARAALLGAPPRGATAAALKAPPCPPTVTRRLPPSIVPDAVYPGMYRIRLPGGSLSVMVNLTRARDAVRAFRESLRVRRAGAGPPTALSAVPARQAHKTTSANARPRSIPQVAFNDLNQDGES
jgi:hypothetical protein